MIVIIHERNGYQDKWSDITRIEEVPGIVNLYRLDEDSVKQGFHKSKIVKQVTLVVRLEVIP